MRGIAFLLGHAIVESPEAWILSPRLLGKYQYEQIHPSYSTVEEGILWQDSMGEEGMAADSEVHLEARASAILEARS